MISGRLLGRRTTLQFPTDAVTRRLFGIPLTYRQGGDAKIRFFATEDPSTAAQGQAPDDQSACLEMIVSSRRAVLAGMPACGPPKTLWYRATPP